MNKVSSANITKLTRIYRDLASIPVATKGDLVKRNEHQYTLRIDSTINDMDQIESVTSAEYFNIDVKSNEINVEKFTEPIDSTNDIAWRTSSNGKYKAIVRKNLSTGNGKGDKLKSYIELWQSNRKIKSLTGEFLSNFHGDIVTSAIFSSIQFSPNESKLLYVADAKRAKSESFFKQTVKKANSSTTTTDADGEKPDELDRYSYLEDWGEQHDQIVHPSLCVYDLSDDVSGDEITASKEVKVISCDGLSVAQPFWLNENEIAFIGYKEQPRKLGIVFCPIRECALYKIKLNDEKIEPKILFSKNNYSLKSPRLHLNGEDVYMLAYPTFGPHFKSCQLLNYNLVKQTVDVIIDHKQKLENNANEMISLYVFPNLPVRCFTNDGKFLFVESWYKTKHVIYVVNLITKTISALNAPSPCVSILDIRDNLLVIFAQSLTIKSSVFIANIAQIQSDGSFELNYVKVCENGDLTSEMSYTVNYFNSSDDPDGKLPIATILMKSLSSIKHGTVVIPHGGPHSLSFERYSSISTTLAKIGYQSLFINYRGSCGVNDEMINYLCGKVGDTDVKDVIEAIDYHVGKNEIDEKNVFLFGGSHGGFLVTHLIGQHADRNFKACIALNPVTDIASMSTGTDISDWCFIESLGHDFDYNHKTIVNEKFLSEAIKRSPITHVSKAKAPTLMLLGKCDRRVPMQQGLEYYRALKAFGVETFCYVYEDRHDLSKFDGEVMVLTLDWILKHS